MKFVSVVVTSGIVLLSAVAVAQHADVSPRVENGKIITDAFVDGGGGLIPDVRVFGYDFQEDPQDPYFAADPGFNALTGSGLPVSSQLLFNVLSPTPFGLPANLTFWNGGGNVSFGAVPDSETLKLNLGSQHRIIGNGTAEVTGFSLGTVEAGGILHRHLNSFLQGADGDPDPTNGFPPTDGIFLLALELASSDSGIADSAPFFIVFNNGLDEEVHDEAIEFVQTTYVPEPSLGSFTVIAGMAICARRSRRREEGRHS